MGLIVQVEYRMRNGEVALREQFYGFGKEARQSIESRTNALAAVAAVRFLDAAGLISEATYRAGGPWEGSPDPDLAPPPLYPSRLRTFPYPES